MHTALTVALRATWPDEAQTLLLRACLLPGPAGREALDSFVARHPEPMRLLASAGRGQRRLAPLLTERLGGSSTRLGHSELTRLRTATFREELRSREYARILVRLLRALEAARIPTLALKGAALAHTVYSAPHQRHSHDIELLVSEADDAAITSAVRGAGFRPSANSASNELHFEHPSGLPFVVQRRLFRSAAYDIPWKRLWDRRGVAAIAGHRAHVLSPADNLHHVCVHASFSPSRASLAWACDAWLLAENMSPAEWDPLLEVVERARSAVPMRSALAYVAEKLDASVAANSLAGLERLCERVTPVERDHALRSIRTSRNRAVGIPTRGRLRDRAWLAWWRAFPSADYLRQADPPERPRPVALHRLRRPGRWARASLASALRHPRPRPGRTGAPT